ncbi:DUF898 domain-containing protein [Puniceicoccaceae bacterium K14]|nr:DUF898 domain-containing protein [Puniceicoccaceae bacterium K14]
MEDSSPTPPPSPKDFPMQFHGSASEYFKIWIVNLALTVLTLGIYYPWAMVRTRRYFYANTELDSHRFDYLADPKKMLKGYLLIYTAIILYVLGMNNIISPFIGFIVIMALIALGPFLMAASLRFRHHNTSYRNVRFKFLGRTSDAYAVYWGYALLTYITLGIMFPIFRLKIYEYIFDNSSLGKTPFSYKGEGGPMYTIFLSALGLMIAIAAIFMTPIIVFGIFQSGNVEEGAAATDPMFFLIMGSIYLVYFIGFAFISGFIRAKTLRYNLSVLTLGYEKDVSFKSDLNVWKFVWLNFTNIFATFFSLGLLSAWAKVRATKMVLSSISVVSQQGDLGSHESVNETDQSATGEAAVDAMDFDVGF